MSADPVDIIKEELKKKSVHMNSFEQVDFLLFKISDEEPKRLFITFEDSILKNYFLENVPYIVINCNSSYERFCNDMMCSNQVMVFNNLNHCNDFDILNILKDTNSLILQ